MVQYSGSALPVAAILSAGKSGQYLSCGVSYLSCSAANGFPIPGKNSKNSESYVSEQFRYAQALLGADQLLEVRAAGTAVCSGEQLVCRGYHEGSAILCARPREAFCTQVYHCCPGRRCPMLSRVRTKAVALLLHFKLGIDTTVNSVQLCEESCSTCLKHAAGSSTASAFPGSGLGS